MKNLNTILPFYVNATGVDDLLIQQDRYREYVDVECPLVCFADAFLPFVIRRSMYGGALTDLTFELWKRGGTSAFASYSPATYLSIEFGVLTGYDYDYIFYFGTNLAAAITDFATPFYLKIVDSFPAVDVVYYSELFMIRPASERWKYTKLKFWNALTTPFLNEIPYGISAVPATFYQWVFIDNIFKVPTYLREDTGDKIDNILIREKQSVQKQMKLFNVLTPEYLLDALAVLPLYDNIEITEGNTGECWTPLYSTISDPEWFAEAKGALAKVDMMFIKWSVIKKLSFVEMSCNCQGYSSSGNVRIQSQTVTIVAETEKTVTWAIPFLTTIYEYTFTAWNANGDPIAIKPGVQRTHDLKFTGLESGTVKVIAVEMG